ncbi:MAG: hypothetical protein F6K48_23625 [Okeania sp. SIO3H1]|nr:hypothetical protein [Okeania sp. SIO3H1]
MKGSREMGRWGDREMGRWGDGEMGRWEPTPNPSQEGDVEKDLTMALRWNIFLY